MILPSKLKEVRKVLEAASPDLKLVVLKSILSEIDDHDERDALETAFLMGMAVAESDEPARVIVLLHGIRTHAPWQDRLAEYLTSDTDIKVVPIGYGYLDVVKFLCPVFTRLGPIRRVLRELRTIRSLNPNAHISVVAHSFGTYILSKILLEETDVKLHRVQLCGSIIQLGYRWDKVISRISGTVINDAGTEDKWPVLAKLASWGYGPSGSFGFKTAVVSDRYFQCGHSDFFEDEHMKKFWLPLLIDGQIVPSPWSSAKRSHGIFISFLNIFPLKSALAIGLIWCATIALKNFHQT